MLRLVADTSNGAATAKTQDPKLQCCAVTRHFPLSQGAESSYRLGYKRMALLATLSAVPRPLVVPPHEHCREQEQRLVVMVVLL